MINSFWRDVTAFVSLIFSLVAVALSYLLGQPILSMQLLVALSLCYLIAFPIKVLFFKRRPDNQQYSNLLQKFDASSFPSVHAMRAVSLGIVLCAYAGSILFTIFTALIILGVMYTRIRLKKHFLVDVFWGTLLGAGIGFLVSYSRILTVLLG